MGKSGSEGYERFVTSEAVRRLKEARMPDVEKEWARLPEAFRGMLYRNAGLDVARVAMGLVNLSQEDRRRLRAANARLGEIQTKAALLLVGAVFFAPRG